MRAVSAVFFVKRLKMQDIAAEPFILTEYGRGYRRVFDKELAKRSIDMQMDIRKQLIFHKNKWMSRSLRTVIEYIKENEFSKG